MKCYTITTDAVGEGIDPALVPVTRDLADAGGMVMDAILVPSTPEREGLDLSRLFTEDLGRAAAVCGVVLDLPRKHRRSGRVMVGYDPRHWYPSEARGDQSVVVYRGQALFILVARPGEMFLRHVSSDKVATLGKRGPVISVAGRVFAEVPAEEDFFVAYIT